MWRMRSILRRGKGGAKEPSINPFQQRTFPNSNCNGINDNDLFTVPSLDNQTSDNSSLDNQTSGDGGNKGDNKEDGAVAMVTQKETMDDNDPLNPNAEDEDTNMLVSTYEFPPDKIIALKEFLFQAKEKGEDPPNVKTFYHPETGEYWFRFMQVRRLELSDDSPLPYLDNPHGMVYKTENNKVQVCLSLPENDDTILEALKGHFRYKKKASHRIAEAFVQKYTKFSVWTAFKRRNQDALAEMIASFVPNKADPTPSDGNNSNEPIDPNKADQSASDGNDNSSLVSAIKELTAAQTSNIQGILKEMAAQRVSSDANLAAQRESNNANLAAQRESNDKTIQGLLAKIPDTPAKPSLGLDSAAVIPQSEAKQPGKNVSFDLDAPLVTMSRPTAAATRSAAKSSAVDTPRAQSTTKKKAVLSTKKKKAALPKRELREGFGFPEHCKACENKFKTEHRFCLTRKSKDGVSYTHNERFLEEYTYIVDDVEDKESIQVELSRRFDGEDSA